MVAKVFLAEQPKICKLHVQTYIKTTEHVGVQLGFELFQKQRKLGITSDQGQDKRSKLFIAGFSLWSRHVKGGQVTSE